MRCTAKNASAFIITLVFVFLSIPISVIAHSSSQQGVLEKAGNAGSHKYYGGESVGWIINEERHSASNAVSYTYPLGFPTELTGVLSNAASKWSSVASITHSSQAMGNITTTNQLEENVRIKLASISNGTTGHITSWLMQINSDYVETGNNHPQSPVNSIDIAHEFGHILGLNDLTSSSNVNKIMYYDRNTRTATTPHSRDKWGAKLITGVHTTHTWAYRFVSQNSAGHNTHERYCTSCRGIKYNSFEECTYNSSGICTKCGTPQGGGTQSIGLPEVTGMSLWEEQRRAFRFLA